MILRLLKKTELDIYLDAHRKKVDDTLDILKWSKRHSDTYKVLAEMTRAILVLPISIV